MGNLITVGAYALLVIALVPLLLVGVAALANMLGLKATDRILIASVSLLMLQGFVGSLVNVLGGLAVCALGVWSFFHMPGIQAVLVAAVLVPFGLWRAWIGLVLLKDLKNRRIVEQERKQKQE